MQVDPLSTYVYKLIILGFNLEEKLKIIKVISDVAQKEYAVQIATETLDLELRSIEF